VVVFSVLFFDKIKVDDPVGAISVHGVCGAWGTVAAALFHEELFLGGTEYNMFSQLMTQLIGVVVAFLWVFPASFIMFKVISKTVGLRVSPEEELEGMDLAEHGGIAYPDFAPTTGSGGVITSGGPGSTVVAPASVKEAEA
jgi:Amt family ammonium transporter